MAPEGGFWMSATIHIKFVEATERLNNNRWRCREENGEESDGGDEEAKIVKNHKAKGKVLPHERRGK